MPDFLIPRGQLRTRADPGGLAPSSSHADESELTGHWLAKDGTTELGEPFRIDTSVAKAEAFQPSGQIRHVWTTSAAQELFGIDDLSRVHPCVRSVRAAP